MKASISAATIAIAICAYTTSHGYARTVCTQYLGSANTLSKRCALTPTPTRSYTAAWRPNATPSMGFIQAHIPTTRKTGSRPVTKPNEWNIRYGASRRALDKRLLADCESQIAREERADPVPQSTATLSASASPLPSAARYGEA
jgi:hypothetical protein